MAKFFIDRPVFAIALSILITMVGAIAGFSLPIAQYPDITKPRVSVSTNYTGASALTVEESVAQSIEQKVNGVENMRDMRSTSTNTGEYTLDVTFNLEKDADIAAVEVQNRVAQATTSLPAEVTAYGVTTAKESPQTLMFFYLSSPNKTYDAMFLRTYAMSNFLDAMKRVKGVSEVSEYGPEYAMRIELLPDKMAQLGLTASEVAAAIKNQNIQAPVGSIGTRPTAQEQEMTYSASAEGRLKTPEQFENIIIRSRDGETLRVRDVANVKEGPRMDFPYSEIDGGESVAFAVSITSDANAIETSNGIRAAMAEARTRLPDDMELNVFQDNSDFVKESLEKVAHTFFEALVLVLFVVYIFLGSWRATLIPMLAVPVSLVGTFGAFVLMGFTINTISLFAMILAIGLVVDDAIVVVEAVEHHIQDNGLKPKEATYRAMEEVSGPVVAIAAVLASVFIPTAFMGGTTGELYKQFALTISVSMALSALVALSLTPALCALILTEEKAAAQSKGTSFIDKIIGGFNRWFNRTLERYTNMVGICITHAKLMIIGLVIIVILCGVVAKITPTSYVPEEDQGMIMASYSLPEGAASNRGIQQMQELQARIGKMEGVKHVMGIAGYDILSGAQKASAGIMPIALEDFADRSVTSNDIIAQLFAIGAATPELNIMAFNQPALPGLSETGSLSLYVMNLGGDSVQVMDNYAKEFVKRANQEPSIAVAYTTFNTDTPGLKFDVNREKCESLGVPVADVFATLQTFLGGMEVNDFNNFGRTWKVVMQADANFRNDVRKMNNFYVKSSAGQMIPLDSLVEAQPDMTVPSVSRFNGASAFKIAGSPQNGYSTGEAMAALERIAKEILPMTYTYEWVDQSRDEREAGDQAFYINIISVIFVFLCLSALYESWSIPFAVLFTLPPAVLGCYGSQLLRGLTNDVYMNVALIMLIGLSTKNAILIVEYARMNRDKGEDAVTAAKGAAHLRLRPILMTSFAFILGCLPLAIATGAGAGSRVSMGNAVVGGMTFSTFVGIFLIPVMYVVVDYLAEKLHKKESAKNANA